MQAKKRIFIYPVSSETYKEGANNYISKLISHVSKSYTVINKKSTIGLLDLLIKIPKCDIIYFNWIEDLPHRRFGFLQIPLLILILVLAKIANIKIIWFVHNNISHNKKHIVYKSLIIKVLKRFADIILTHSNELTLKVKGQKIYSFHHPVDDYQPIPAKEPYEYDILIWGTVSPYKGISEFIEFAATSVVLQELKILIAGKFNSDEYYEYINNKRTNNITIINKMLSENELKDYLATSRYILFTYNSSSVLSSASLCKTLSFGKEVIGPDIGSFKELGNERLLYNYHSFTSLERLLDDLRNQKTEAVDKSRLNNYIRYNSWDNFAAFLYDTISSSFIK